jgi:hypothetical protein
VGRISETFGTEGIKHVISFVLKNGHVLLSGDGRKWKKIPDENNGTTPKGPLALPVDAHAFVDHVEEISSNHRDLIDENEVEVIDDAAQTIRRGIQRSLLGCTLCA